MALQITAAAQKDLMTEQEIDLDARLMAIENLLLIVVTSEYLSAGWPIEKVEAQHKEMIAQARSETFPGIAPEMSDHIAAEYEKHMTRLLAAVVEKMKARKR